MIVKVRVIPNSTDNEVISRIGSVLRVKIKTKSLDNQANVILKDFMAEFFNVAEDSVSIVKGAKGKEKTVEVLGKSEEALRKIMDAIP
ncbi:hypothetical protein Dip518_000297 [Parelusimicrobium proximum]|uniref:DUF167 domain-containing protein n=1 Tax=Parelusimicrobium proximum TaxID=3228953 RepID=UPI003D16D487